jgi:hypothetical protein
MRLVADLLKLDPFLRMKPDRRGLAYGCWVGSESGEGDIPGIDLGVNDAFVSFSYSADEDFVGTAMNRIMKLFNRHGYLAYDHQRDCLLSTKGDAQAGVKKLHEIRDRVLDDLEALGETIIVPLRPARKKQQPSAKKQPPKKDRSKKKG